MRIAEAIDQVVTRGSVPEFERFVEGCIGEGIATFFKSLLSITTPAFMLRQYPSMYSRVRRGPSQVEVDLSESDARLRFSSLPNADHELMIATGRACFRVLVQTTGSARPLVEVDHVTQDELSYRVDFGAPSVGRS